MNHGTNASYHAGCRCGRCRQAARDYEANRRRQIAYGRWLPYIDATEARDHVRSLMAPRVGSQDGIGWMRISDLAGVPRSTVEKLIYGDPRRGQPPSRRVRPETAARLLSITEDQRADGSTIPATATRRLVKKMLAGGFSRAELGRYVSGDPAAITLNLRGKRVQVGRAVAIADLHRRWEEGEIVPRGRRPRQQHGPPSPFPATPGPPLCETCGGTPFAGGRWCWDHYQQQRRVA